MALQSRLSHVESYDVRSRASGNEKSNASPSVRKQRASVSKDVVSPTSSPMLKARPSTGDLMFQMDDEAALSPSDSKGKSVIRGMRLGESETPSYPDSPALGASIPEAGSLDGRSFLDQQMSSPPDALLAQSPTAARSIALGRRKPSSAQDAPWSSPVISDGKKDLKDIMGETSQSRVSNLTLGMTGKRESSGTATPKISQKERRKMQQQQMQEKLAAEQRAKEARENPWQLPSLSPSGAQSKFDPLPGQKSPAPQSPHSLKTPQKSSMTLRQTVAGTPPPQPRPVTTPVQTQSRSVSSNMQQPKASPSPSSGPPTPFQQALAKAAPQSSIQSIRHIPRPDANIPGSRSPSYGSLSLAAILEQQQTEKNEIREAATAKHNLEEIQAEQEFQQWWDEESKRVQGLLDPEPQQRGGKSGRGGKASGATGSSRKRRGNKPSGEDGSGSQTQKQSSPAPANRPASKKNPNGNAAGAQQTSSTSQASNGQGKSSRRGGSAARGKGRSRE